MGVFSQKWQVDYDYMKTMGMQIVEGQEFFKRYGVRFCGSCY